MYKEGRREKFFFFFLKTKAVKHWLNKVMLSQTDHLPNLFWLRQFFFLTILKSPSRATLSRLAGRMQPSGCILCRPGLHRSFSIVRVYVNFFFLSGKKKKIVLKSKPADKAFALPTQVSKSRLGAHPLRMFFPSLCDLYAWIVRNRITLTHIHRVLTQYLVNVGEGCLGWGNKVGKKTKKTNGHWVS